MGYEAYAGSLRGARDVLWSQAGNSVDQASLLVALLRTSGVPTRYLHGTLDTFSQPGSAPWTDPSPPPACSGRDDCRGGYDLESMDTL